MGNLLVETLVRAVYNLFGLDSPYSKQGYGPNWSTQRQKCLGRDNHQCRVCGKAESEIGREPAVHHITPRRDFGSNEWRDMNSLSNLVTLCHSCHGKLEGKYIGTGPDEFVNRASKNI